MLGHLRLHRRGHSNPSSPIPDQLSPFDHGEHPNSVPDISSRPDFQPRQSNPTNTPPVRPSSTRPEGEGVPNRKASDQSLRDVTSPSAADASFMGGSAFRRVFEGNRQYSHGSSTTQGSTDKPATRAKPVPPPINTNLASTRPLPIPSKEAQHASSFVAPTDSQKKAVATGKRPPGTRLMTEPPSLAAAAQTVVETQRAKKGLPFLKNSMSGLLLRRKASQNAPDLHSLPMPGKPSETAYQPIRGTKVHDFSAPRTRTIPKRQPTASDVESSVAPTNGQQIEPASALGDLPLRVQTSINSSVAPDASPEGLPDSKIQFEKELPRAPSNTTLREATKACPGDKALPADPPVAPSHTANEAGSTAAVKSRPLSTASSMKRVNPSTRTNKSRHLSLADDAISLSALPKHMKSTSSRFSFDMKGVSEAALAEKLLEERHRQKELESKVNGDSDHADSRYDDFDDDAFDYDAAMMDDGLEEEIPEVNADYDENDYLEEEVPFEKDTAIVGECDTIIEADAEDQNDPDNDQENFAGFVFTRSNPHSSLVSPATPGMLNTPRDAGGRPIGYAFTKDGTPALDSAMSILPDEGEAPEPREADMSLAGLGIQGLEVPPKTQYDPTVFQERRHLPPIEDLESGQDKGLYYDGGLLDELQMEASEIQQSAFDENLFDLDDVDEFGRPLPGVFQQNLDMRNKTQGHKQRDSDMTSPGSAASGSTAHTSVSVGVQPQASAQDALIATNPPVSLTSGGLDSAVSLKDVAATKTLPATHDTYQKALLESVQKAAASGWKSRWDNDDDDDDDAEEKTENEKGKGVAQVQGKDPTLKLSQPGDYDVTITSPTTNSQPSPVDLRGVQANQADDSDEDHYIFDDNSGFDDDDYFDDDFIAEANAEALAYDDEGFYGTEFGFYSSPPPARPSGPSVSESESPISSNSIFGGYFGPSGAVGRSLSGRVLREPNLTPITEMSESGQWSNRNSLMSMGLPGSATLADFRSANLGLAHVGGGGDDFDFTVGSLNQLRSRAFGGSQISLNSSRDGSPRSERAPMHAERFETSSPMPWDVNRPQSHLGFGPALSLPSHERMASLWSSNSDTAGSPSVAGFPPPQPLTSPPPIPQSTCPPVLEEEVECRGVSGTG
ncbi:unnamed protein product [Discula destructiva]